MAKISPKLEEFTETYSSILSGIHSDMMKYRKEVTGVQEGNKKVEESVLSSYLEIQRVDRTNIKTREEISGLHSEVTKYYEKFRTSFDEVKILNKNLETTKLDLGKQHLQLQQELEDVNSKLKLVTAKQYKFEDEMVKKGQKLNLLQNLFYGVSFLVVLILILSLFLGKWILKF